MEKLKALKENAIKFFENFEVGYIINVKEECIRKGGAV